MTNTFAITIIALLVCLFLAVILYLIFGKKQSHEISFDIGAVEAAKVKITRIGNDVHIELTEAEMRDMPINPNYKEPKPVSVSVLSDDDIADLIRAYQESEDDIEKERIITKLNNAHQAFIDTLAQKDKGNSDVNGNKQQGSTPDNNISNEKESPAEDKDFEDPDYESGMEENELVADDIVKMANETAARPKGEPSAEEEAAQMTNDKVETPYQESDSENIFNPTNW